MTDLGSTDTVDPSIAGRSSDVPASPDDNGNRGASGAPTGMQGGQVAVMNTAGLQGGPRLDGSGTGGVSGMAEPGQGLDSRGTDTVVGNARPSDLVYVGFLVSKINEVNSTNYEVWCYQLRNSALGWGCQVAFENDLPGTLANGSAMGLLLGCVPAMWMLECIHQGSACKALKFIKSKFEGGANTDYVADLRWALENLRLGSGEDLEEYVYRARALHLRLEANGRQYSFEDVVHRVVQGLPAVFDQSKSTMRQNGIRDTLDGLLSSMKREARLIGWVPSRDQTEVLSRTLKGQGRGTRILGQVEGTVIVTSEASAGSVMKKAFGQRLRGEFQWWRYAGGRCRCSS